VAAIGRFLVFERRLYAARTRYTYVECALARLGNEEGRRKWAMTDRRPIVPRSK